jgi:enoyl-CoA hydratase/carnithine racemase
VLPRVSGTSAALDLLLSGRTFLAEEAERLGVVDHLSEEGEAAADAHAYASELASLSSPASMAAIKRQVYADLEQGLAESTADALVQMERSFERPDFREGVESFVERRPPRFPPLTEPDRAPRG